MKEFIKEILKLSYILSEEGIQFAIECISHGIVSYMYYSDDYEFDFDKIGAITFLSVYIEGGVNKRDYRESAPINEFYTRLSEMCGDYNLEYLCNIKASFAKISFYDEKLTGLKPGKLQESVQTLDWEKLLKDIIDLTFIVKDEGLHYVIYGETATGATHLIFDSEKEYMSTRYHELEDHFEGLWITFRHVNENDGNYLEFRDRLSDVAKKWNMNFVCSNPYNIRIKKKSLRESKVIQESKVSDIKSEIESISYILKDEGDGIVVEQRDNVIIIVNIFYNGCDKLLDEDYYEEYLDRVSEICNSKGDGCGYRKFRDRDDILIIELPRSYRKPTNESKSQLNLLVSDIKDLNYIMNDENIQVDVNGKNETVYVNLIFDRGRRFKALFVGTSLYKEYYDRVSSLCDEYGYRLRKGVKVSKEGKFTKKEVDDFKFVATKRHKSSKRIVESIWNDDDLIEEIKRLNVILEDEGLGVKIDKPNNGTIRKPEYHVVIYPSKSEISRPCRYYDRRWSISGDIQITKKEYLDKLPKINLPVSKFPPFAKR